MDNFVNKCSELMEKAITSFARDLRTISTGRATPSLLDMIRVDNYGNLAPLNQICNISVSDSSTLFLQVWDKGQINSIAKSISDSNLGFNPIVDGQSIRISIPPLSEERRREMCKLAKKYSEDKKIAIRLIRQDILNEVKRDKDSFSEDEIKQNEKKIQELTDKNIKKIDEMLSDKEKDILSI